MSDRSSFDLGAAVALLVATAVILAITIRLLPVLLRIAWQVLPGIVVLWFIIAVLRGMVQKLLR